MTDQRATRRLRGRLKWEQIKSASGGFSLLEL
jgi:hypothetical protein